MAIFSHLRISLSIGICKDSTSNACRVTKFSCSGFKTDWDRARLARWERCTIIFSSSCSFLHKDSKNSSLSKGNLGSHIGPSFIASIKFSSGPDADSVGRYSRRTARDFCVFGERTASSLHSSLVPPSLSDNKISSRRLRKISKSAWMRKLGNSK